MSHLRKAGGTNQQSKLMDLRPSIRGLILDMDGVLWKEDVPIGDLPGIFAAISSLGLSVALATNNATRTADQYLEKLRGFGVELESGQVVTSSEATARILGKRFPLKARIFVVGEEGVIKALRASGFVVITDPADEGEVVALVGGIDRALTYQKLERATYYARRGVPFYGTNPDATFPTPGGLIPGAGAILAAIATAAERAPTVIGKPSPFMLEIAAERMHLKKEELLVVGDRLETDVAAGQAFGARTALVLSGVSTREQSRVWKPQPDLVAEDLAQLVGL